VGTLLTNGATRRSRAAWAQTALAQVRGAWRRRGARRATLGHVARGPRLDGAVAGLDGAVVGLDGAVTGLDRAVARRRRYGGVKGGL